MEGKGRHVSGGEGTVKGRGVEGRAGPEKGGEGRRGRNGPPLWGSTIRPWYFILFYFYRASAH